MTSEPPVGFGEFLLDGGNARLWRGTQALTLPPKVLAVLQHLVRHAGQLVTKDELWRAVWPDVTVTDAALTVCLSELRQALGDDPKAPRFIETVHRRGYRFIAPVAATQPVQSQKSKVQSPYSAIHNPQSAINLVGRESELSHLHRCLETALHGQRQLVFVTGEPGIGKTALVETFLRPLDTVDTLRLGRGQCIEHYGAGEPYLPVLQALGELGRGADHDHFLTVLRHYAPSWLVQLPALLEAAERETLAAVKK